MDKRYTQYILCVVRPRVYLSYQFRRQTIRAYGTSATTRHNGVQVEEKDYRTQSRLKVLWGPRLNIFRGPYYTKLGFIHFITYISYIQIICITKTVKYVNNQNLSRVVIFHLVECLIYQFINVIIKKIINIKFSVKFTYERQIPILLSDYLCVCSVC